MSKESRIYGKVVHEKCVGKTEMQTQTLMDDIYQVYIIYL